MNLTSVFSRNKDLFSFISRPWYKENIKRRSGIRTVRDRGEGHDLKKKILHRHTHVIHRIVIFEFIISKYNKIKTLQPQFKKVNLSLHLKTCTLIK